jgi:hypothetical protein
VTVEHLLPRPDQSTQFAWSHCVTVPEKPGCYALVTYGGEVLYVGLAAVNVRTRMQVHLDTAEKRAGGADGVPFWFYYLLRKASEVNAIERWWMNQAFLEDGEMPVLNKIYSPV